MYRVLDSLGERKVCVWACIGPGSSCPQFPVLDDDAGLIQPTAISEASTGA